MLAESDSYPNPAYLESYPGGPLSSQHFLTNHKSRLIQTEALLFSHTSRNAARMLLLLAVLLIQVIGVVGLYASSYISLNPFLTEIRNEGRNIVELFVDYQIFVGYLLIFILDNGFAVYLAIDSLLNKNTPQLIGLCIFQAAIGLYGVELSRQFAILTERIVADENHPVAHSIRWKLIAVPGIIGITTLILCWLTWFLYSDFGWLIFRKLGAQIELKIAMRIKSTFFLLQKLKFFFEVGFCVMMIQMRKQSSEGEKEGDMILDVVLPSLYLATNGFVIVLSIIAVEMELPYLMSIYMILWLGEMSFSCYAIVLLYEVAQETNTEANMIFWLSIAFILVSATFVLSILCYKNFGKGLKKAFDHGFSQGPCCLRIFRNPENGPREHSRNVLRTKAILD